MFGVAIFIMVCLVGVLLATTTMLKTFLGAVAPRVSDCRPLIMYCALSEISNTILYGSILLFNNSIKFY